MSFSPTMSGPWTSRALIPDCWGLPCSVALIPSCMCACVPHHSIAVGHYSCLTIQYLFCVIFQVLEKLSGSPYLPVLTLTSVLGATRKRQQGGQTRPAEWRGQNRSRREGKTLGHPVMHSQQIIHTGRRRLGTRDSSQDRGVGEVVSSHLFIVSLHTLQS
jgi:hypothetical protein